MKNYISKMSYEDEWDIMRMAIAKGDVSLVYSMLKDGYSLSLEILEAVYRFFGIDAVIMAVDAYHGDISENDECMAFLEEVLEPSTLVAVLERNAKMLKKKEQERQEKLEQNIKAIFSNLEKTCSDRIQFYRSIQSNEYSADLIYLAFVTYGKDNVWNELNKLGLLVKNFEGKVYYDSIYLSWFDIEYLYENKYVKAAAEYLSQFGIIVNNHAEWAVKIAKAGGLEHFVNTNSYLYFLFDDEELCQEAKKLGAKGYKAIYRYAEDYFTIEDWYEWYKLDKEAAMKRYHKFDIPCKWLFKNGYIKEALFKVKYKS